MTTKDICALAATAADDKKAEGIISLHVKPLTTVAEYFLLCKARSFTQAKAIADELEFQLEKAGIQRLGMDGYSSDSGWVLLDFGAVMVSVFYDVDFLLYDNLCKLWIDAEKTEFFEGESA